MNKSLVQTYAALLVLTVGALLIVQQLDISYPLDVRTSSRSSELSVVGEGKIDAVPDTATITVGISVTNIPTVQEAQSKINDINNRIIATLGALDIAKSDIKTSNYSIYPYYSSDPQARVTGYNGNVSITIQTHKMDKVSEVITQATAAGANEVQGVSFSIDNPDALREKAREEAIGNAKDQAQKLAKQLGIRLGKITNIVESNNGGNIVPYYEKAALPIGGGGPQVEPGSQTITSMVTLYFEKH